MSIQCVRRTFQQVLRISRKIAVVRYDNSDIAASAYTKMTMVSPHTFNTIYFGAIFQSRVFIESYGVVTSRDLELDAFVLVSTVGAFIALCQR